MHDQEGITRTDSSALPNGRITNSVWWIPGGIIEHPEDNISRQMQEQVDAALNEARVIVFVVDGQHALTRVDREVRDRRSNTASGSSRRQQARQRRPDRIAPRYHFYELGLGDPFPISSGHGLGIDALRDAIVEHLPVPELLLVLEPSEDGEEAKTGKTLMISTISKPPMTRPSTSGTRGLRWPSSGSRTWASPP